MKRRSAFWKDTFREIKRSIGRYISLIVITALGAGAVAGILATSINMRAIADKTYKEKNLYDIQIKSTAGFSGDDITALSGVPGAGTVMPTYVFDAYAYLGNEVRTMRTFALPGELNVVELTQGRLPGGPYECAVERAVLRHWGLKIGDSVKLGLDKMDDYNSMFNSEEFTITGVVTSPFFIIPYDRGSTSLGDGRLHYYMYLHPDAYAPDVYTDVYIQMEGSRSIDNLSEDYYGFADEWVEQLKKTGDIRIQAKTDELNGFFTPEWFYFTRKDVPAFDSYYQDTMRLESIGYVFPIVFFIVAVLVSLTTMSRMVDEQRTQIGIYKALGYRTARIVLKLLIYSFTAGVTGGALGVIAGSLLFPRVIFGAYLHMYDMPPIETPIPVTIGLVSTATSVGLVMFATVFTSLRSMRDAPAELMRPKSPPSGKRILLEKIPFVWNRLKFTGKVTSRNIFRYKKRFFMTLAGVSGCTAILLTSFGLRDSLAAISELQYGKLASYTSRAYIKELDAVQQRWELDSVVPGERLYIREESVTVEGAAFSVSMIIPEKTDEIGAFINLRSRKTGDTIPMPDASGILVTEKLAREAGVSAGDSLKITANDGGVFTLPVTGVVENYVMHHVYMPPALYLELFGSEPLYNSILIIMEEGSAILRDRAVWQSPVSALLDNSSVRAIVHTANLLEDISDSTDALEIVAIVLIFLASALAFVVLFNLTNINILERIRELATIKVLGFYNEELSMYIYRENAIVTVMGIALGLAAGVFLHGYVLQAAEIDLLMFPRIIRVWSYVYSILLSVAFAVFVNLVMNFKLAGIDMVESLKNVE